MSSDQTDQGDQYERARQLYEKTQSRVQTVGYVVLFAVVFALTIPMVVAMVDGLQTGEIEDPFTGEQVVADEVDVDCVDEAIVLAGADEQLDWERRYRRWRERCDDEYEQLFQMLQRIRDQRQAGPGG